MKTIDADYKNYKGNVILINTNRKIPEIFVSTSSDVHKFLTQYFLKMDWEQLQLVMPKRNTEILMQTTKI